MHHDGKQVALALPDVDELASELRRLKERIYELERRTRAMDDDELLGEGQMLAVLLCRLEERRVAFALADVQEVTPIPAMASLPEAPPWFAGMLNLRGVVLPVIDVRARIERRERALELSDQVVVCRARERLVGLMVSQVEGVEELRIMSRDQEVAVVHGPYVRATLEGDHGIVLLLSALRLLQTSDVPSSDATAQIAGENR